VICAATFSSACARSLKVLAGPVGVGRRRSLSYGHPHPELAGAVRQRVLEPRQRAVDDPGSWRKRGEVHPEALAPECVAAGPAVILQQFLADRCERIPDETITRIADNVVLPMVRRPPGTQTRTAPPGPAATPVTRLPTGGATPAPKIWVASWFDGEGDLFKFPASARHE
jgi:hypothetical protein